MAHEMNWERAVEITSWFSAIATAIVAVIAYGRYLFTKWKQRVKLERHLKAIKDLASEPDNAKRTVVGLMSELRMSDSEILDAAYRSKHIRLTISLRYMGEPQAISMEYSEEKIS